MKKIFLALIMTGVLLSVAFVKHIEKAIMEARRKKPDVGFGYTEKEK